MSTASNFNLEQISSAQMLDHMRATIQIGGAAYFVGRRGSSKTMTAKKAIKDSGCKEIYINLSTFERVDLGGYPNFFAGQKTAFIDFLMPYWYKALMEGDEPCVLLLDEVDKVSSDIYAPLLEIVQFRTINGTPLPNLKAVLMTGNLLNEGGQRPMLPLLDRAEKFLIEMNINEFLDWGGLTGSLHPSVSAYLHDHKSDLYGEEDPGEVFADPSPRGWHNASTLLFFGEKNGWHNDMMKHKISGCVGKKVGMKYAAFFDHYQVLLPTVERIMNGEKTPEFKDFQKTKQLIVGMIICQRFAGTIDTIWNKLPEKTRNPNNFKFSPKEKEVSDNISKFMSAMDIEMGLIAMRTQIGMQRALNSNLLMDENWDGILNNMISRLNGSK